MFLGGGGLEEFFTEAKLLFVFFVEDLDLLFERRLFLFDQRVVDMLQSSINLTEKV